MRGRLSAGAGALAVALCATAGTAHAAPPAGVNPKVVELEIVDCGEFTGSVTVVTTGTGQGRGSIVGFAGGQVGIVIGFTPAAERFPGELLDCTLEVEGTEMTFPIFVPQP